MANFNKSSRESEDRTLLPVNRYQQKLKPTYPRNYALESKYAKKPISAKTIDTLCIVAHCSALGIDHISFSKDDCVRSLLSQKYIRQIKIGQDDSYKLTKRGTEYFSKIIKYASQMWGK